MYMMLEAMMALLSLPLFCSHKLNSSCMCGREGEVITMFSSS